MAEERANQNESTAERGQAKPGEAPILVKEVEDEERPDCGKADALKADDQAVPPNLADNAPERRALGIGMRDNADDGSIHRHVGKIKWAHAFRARELVVQVLR
jgi:hypothetical protein